MTVATKSRPIIMSADSIRAILDDRKTQTRRVVKPQPVRVSNDWDWDAEVGEVVIYNGWPHRLEESSGRNKSAAGELYPRKLVCPYGGAGDLLWVRETWAVAPKWDDTKPRDLPDDIAVFHAADDSWLLHGAMPRHGFQGRTRSAQFMPHRFARIERPVVNVRVQRVQEISDEDALAEGVPSIDNGNPTNAFPVMWDSLNAKRGHPWANNDWVWAITFERAEKLA